MTRGSTVSLSGRSRRGCFRESSAQFLRPEPVASRLSANIARIRALRDVLGKLIGFVSLRFGAAQCPKESGQCRQGALVAGFAGMRPWSTRSADGGILTLPPWASPSPRQRSAGRGLGRGAQTLSETRAGADSRRDGLLSPLLSSKGGEGEALHVGRVHGPDARSSGRGGCPRTSIGPRSSKASCATWPGKFPSVKSPPGSTMVWPKPLLPSPGTPATSASCFPAGVSRTVT